MNKPCHFCERKATTMCLIFDVCQKCRDKCNLTFGGFE